MQELIRKHMQPLGLVLMELFWREDCNLSPSLQHPGLSNAPYKRTVAVNLSKMPLETCRLVLGHQPATTRLSILTCSRLASMMCLLLSTQGQASQTEV